ncbi:leucine-rich repeat flightless-interacting protein 2 isoform X2 [Pygocentrus nattereri]|uniref:leucine-rich repeat flightless-interacting protein 2 isoform X2 n=1 Tax=Pygocentrus nattereri TaxID=42514 RepID=UPI001890B8A8|nr:leucine-rich repeat flightless-interacting protein 2 isoform X2 [Pygocentrus nattereri]
MGTQVTGRKRIPNRERLTAEDDALSQIAREAEARLAAKRAARAEAREIRMKELERQQKEIYQAQKEDSERYSRHSRRHASISDDEERMSVGSRGSLRGNYSDLCSSTGSLPSSRLQNGRPSALFSDAPRSRSHRGSLYEENVSSARRFSGSSTRGPSDYSGFLGSSSRASSRASSARASPVVEERSDFLEKGSRTASTLSAATLASLGGGLSRRGSCDTSISADTEASIREIKDSLAEVEEKYRKAMVSNAQLDNEKSNLMYQVDTLRDTLMELEELLYETRRECDERTKECERERHAHSILQFQFSEMKETLKQSEELLTGAQQLRTKQESYVNEISDLQETLEWKEKKIGALERQKEYSDIIRDERDALRDEIFRLKEALKKHGIVLGSEVTTNGEMGGNTIDTQDDEESASRLSQDPHAPNTSGDNILERAPEDRAPKKDRTSRRHLRTRLGSRSHLPILKRTISSESASNPEEEKRSTSEDKLRGTVGTPCKVAKGAVTFRSSSDMSRMQMHEDMQVPKAYVKVEQSIRDGDFSEKSEYHEEKITNQLTAQYPKSASAVGHASRRVVDCSQEATFQESAGEGPSQDEASRKASGNVIKPVNDPEAANDTKPPENQMENTADLLNKAVEALSAQQSNSQSILTQRHSAVIRKKRQSDDETVGKTETPETSKSCQDLTEPQNHSDVEMMSTSREVHSLNSEQEQSETESQLETEDFALTMPVEEKGIATFLDSCQEAGLLDFEVIRLDQSNTPSRADDLKEATAAGDRTGKMRLKTKKSNECSVS